MPNFEVYRRQRAPVSSEPTVTVQKLGTFSMNSAAYDALSSPSAVELLFDKNERLLGIRKADPSARHAYGLRSVGKTTWIFSGKAFSVYYGIDTSETRRYSAQMDGEVLVVDLKEPGSEVTSNRAQSRQPQEGLPEPLL
jgi:hypothetical protein